MWINVPIDSYLDPIENEYIDMKAIYFKNMNRDILTSINSTGQDIDLIALDTMGDVDNINDIVLQNASNILDYNFDWNKITILDIPI